MPETSDDLANQERFWDEESGDFDAIYSGTKSSFAGWLDRTFRQDMQGRFEFTMQHAAPIEGRTFLDLGCGSGRYSVPLAEAGAAHVYAVDVARNMLELGQRTAERAGVSDRISWTHGDIAAYSGEPVDVSLAIGLFDYVADPLAVLRGLRRLTKSRVLASFPRLNTWRAPARKARLALRGCPVYFFRKRNLETTIAEAGLRICVLEQVGKLWCVVAEPTSI